MKPMKQYYIRPYIINNIIPLIILFAIIWIVVTLIVFVKALNYQRKFNTENSVYFSESMDRRCINATSEALRITEVISAIVAVLETLILLFCYYF